MSLEQLLQQLDENTLAQSPLAFGISDPNNRVIRASLQSARTLGYQTMDQTLGKTAYDIPNDIIVKSASVWHQQNHKMVESGQEVRVLDVHCYTGEGLKAYLTRKIPIKDAAGHVEGIYYVSHPLEDRLIKTVLLPNLFLRDHKCFGIGCITQDKISISYELVQCFSDLNLSVRESECFYFLMRGWASRAIARVLYISPRTVETHTDHIKQKLGCSSKAMLIEMAFALGYTRTIPVSLVMGFVSQGVFAPAPQLSLQEV